jgi:transcriptional regulator with GAF, ATPase, and Fis domain
VIERAVLLSRGSVLRLDGVLTERGDVTNVERASPAQDGVRTVIPEAEWRRRERENLRIALELANERIYGPDGAAEILGLKPTTLISRLKALGMR